jgi:hypothetical protein
MKGLSVVLALSLAVVTTAYADNDADKKVVERWVNKVYNGDDRDYAIENVTDDFPLEPWLAWYDSISVDYGTSEVTILEMVAEAGAVAVHWDFKGISNAEASQGKVVENSGMSLIKVVNGKIASDTGYWPTLAEHQQLGYTLVEPQEKAVQQVILAYHEGIKTHDHEINRKIFDETYLTLNHNDSTDTWHSTFRDHMHTDLPPDWFDQVEYDSQVEFVRTTIRNDNAAVDVIETGGVKNPELGTESSWNRYRNVWLLHKNANNEWKIVGAVFLGAVD